MSAQARGRNGSDEAAGTMARHELLAHHVETPVPTTDRQAEAALRRARERWNAAGAILSTAESAEDYTLAARIIEDGLRDVSQAYARIGLPGPTEP